MDAPQGGTAIECAVNIAGVGERVKTDSFLETSAGVLCALSKRSPLSADSVPILLLFGSCYLCKEEINHKLMFIKGKSEIHSSPSHQFGRLRQCSHAGLRRRLRPQEFFRLTLYLQGPERL